MEEIKNKAYNAWRNMHKRCYYPKYKSYEIYGGAGVTVCEEWHDRDTFEQWYIARYFEGCHLDKDFLSPERKIYSPETCILVPSWINCILGNGNRNKGKHNLPQGVYPIFKSSKFRAQINMGPGTKIVHLGTFLSPEEAHKAYLVAKRDYIDSRREEMMTYHPELYNRVVELL